MAAGALNRPSERASGLACHLLPVVINGCGAEAVQLGQAARHEGSENDHIEEGDCCFCHGVNAPYRKHEFAWTHWPFGAVQSWRVTVGRDRADGPVQLLQ